MDNIIKKQRGVIITDSLGCPRAETNVEATWVDNILKINCFNYYFYTFCKHGAHSKSIPIEDIIELKPDLVIIQIGIVDACRRVMSEKIEVIVKKIPLIRGIMHKLSKKYHYQLTKLFNIHYASISDFESVFTKLLTRTSSKIIYCAIAPAGDYLKSRTYDVVNDINKYNGVVKHINSDRIIFINPWNDNQDFLLEDGHHLNEKGMELVYNAITDELRKDGE